MAGPLNSIGVELAGEGDEKENLPAPSVAALVIPGTDTVTPPSGCPPLVAVNVPAIEKVVGAGSKEGTGAAVVEGEVGLPQADAVNKQTTTQRLTQRAGARRGNVLQEKTDAVENLKRMVRLLSLHVGRLAWGSLR